MTRSRMVALGGCGIAAVVQSAPPAVIHLPAAAVEAAFVKGQPLIEADAFAVHASRRDAPGQVEVHEHETDVIYVLDGRATLVTGGHPIEPTTIAPGEVRAAAVTDGTTRMLAAHDVVVVPKGVPHWFQSVQAPLTYYVVKVR